MADLDVGTAILSVSTPGTAFLPKPADAAALAGDRGEPIVVANETRRLRDPHFDDLVLHKGDVVPKSLRGKLDSGWRFDVLLARKTEAKSQLTFTLEGLADAESVEEQRALWKERLGRLEQSLASERG